MANTNTDQVVRPAEVAVIAAPTAATATAFQRSASAAQARGAGNANIEIPGQFKAISNGGSKIKVRAYGNSKLATVGSQAITVTISAVNAAGTAVVIATTGAIAAASQAGAVAGWYLEAELLVDPAASVTYPGEYQGVALTGALVARTALVAQPGFSRTAISGTSAAQGLDENQFFIVSVTQAIADATAVHTLTQLSTEVL